MNFNSMASGPSAFRPLNAGFGNNLSGNNDLSAEESMNQHKIAMSYFDAFK